MATVVHTQPSSNENVYKIIQWGPLTTANTTGDWVDIRGYLIASVEWLGTVGGSTPVLDLQGSNQTFSAPSVGTAIAAFNSSTAKLTTLTSAYPACARIRPILTSGGDGTTSVTAAVLLVRGS